MDIKKEIYNNYKRYKKEQKIFMLTVVLITILVFAVTLG